MQLYLDYRRDLADLEDHLGFVRDSHRQGLAAAAWNFDRPLVEAQLEGLVGSPWVAAEVRYGRDEEQRASLGGPVEGEACMGVYAEVLEPGVVRVGDELRVL